MTHSGTSIVTVVGDNVSRCGYCQSADSSVSFGLWAYELTCKDYQALLNRGWRRSGKYLYKPNQRASCCASYGIRLEAAKFQFRRGHKKVVKHFAKCLRETIVPSITMSTNTGVEHNRNVIGAEQLQQLLAATEQEFPDFSVTTVLAAMDEEVYELYVQYQTCIHHDDPSEITRKQFKRFLVDSPLVFEERDGWPVPGFGTVHQKYYIAGRLVAVAVLDILPEFVSSVYLMYHPDYASFGLGKYSALREIDLTRTLATFDPKLKYYCMGLYIHTCPKMRYKGDYAPSDLLDPMSNSWHPLEQYRPLLDVQKFVSIDGKQSSDDAPPGMLDWHLLRDSELGAVIVWYRQQAWKANHAVIRQVSTYHSLLQFVAAVGVDLAHDMILVLDDS